MSNCPVQETRLRQIASDACDSAFGDAEMYEHSKTEDWNSTIINRILQSLISETPRHSSTEHVPYKFAVNSTVIQHLSDPRSSGSDSSSNEKSVEHKAGRRGMHSAAGAYWNNERDGMWSYKYEGGESKGMDVVISVMWIAV